VKYSRGGLVDAEYAVQYLQLLHGGERPALRTPSTLEALEELRTGGLLSAEEGDELREAYIYWRRISEALRMVHGAARDLVLPEAGSEELGFLARRMRYEAASWPEAAAALLADVEAHRERTRTLFNRRFAAAP
jgi:glutamate-ammonia-ligase adenylyltransferase